MKSSTKKILVATGIFAATLFTPGAHAANYLLIHWSVQDDPANWVSVEMIGAQAGLAFVRFKRGANVIPPANLPSGLTGCENGLFYIDIAQPHGKLIYQQLLLAKNTGKRMSRVDFSQETANALCYVHLIAQIE